MKILGISCFFHDAAAVLIDDGILLSAAEEERFSRVKHDFNFPSNAINFCLAKANLNSNDLDAVVFFEKPFLKFERILQTSVASFPRTTKLFNQSMRTWLFDKIWIKSQIKEFLDIDDKYIFLTIIYLMLPLPILLPLFKILQLLRLMVLENGQLRQLVLLLTT